MKRLLHLILLLFITGSSVQAQESEGVSAQISISTQVITSIELITVNSITFGNTQPGQQILNINPINDVSAGFMIAAGTPNAAFRLNYIPSRQINRVDGPGYITFVYQISGNDIEDQSSSEIFQNNSRNFTFNSNGRYYFWVGGRVNLANANPGNYEGDFTIEIEYI
jgi:hypothetical protein